MTQIILIYAKCLNPTAKGDFSLAGNIAKELVDEIKKNHGSIDVILTSTRDNTPRYEQLYGKSVKGRLSLEGRDVGLYPIDDFYLVKNEIIAFIEANRCAYAPAKLLKRVLSPHSKILFIGAANQSILTSGQEKWVLENKYPQDQPEIYHYFHLKDKLISNIGIGKNKFRLHAISQQYNLPELTPEEKKKIPSKDYGFIYVNAAARTQSQKIIEQYIKLTAFNKYSLVGNFTAFTANQTSPPELEIHQSLSNTLMRSMCAKATGNLVVSTGVMSTLEAMQDGKLTFYQDLEVNSYFVTSYLEAIKAATHNPEHTELARLLFAAKPLLPPEMEKIANLLLKPNISKELIEINRRVIRESNDGPIAVKIMNFINTPCHTTSDTQLKHVCAFLSAPGEKPNSISVDQAVRRAAAKGLLFELKVLIKYLACSDINKQDNTEKQFTALHWAIHCHQNESALLLIESGINLNIQDRQGITPLHLAVLKANKILIALLVQKGAKIVLNHFLPTVETIAAEEMSTYPPLMYTSMETMNDESLPRPSTSYGRLFSPKRVIRESQDELCNDDRKRCCTIS